MLALSLPFPPFSRVAGCDFQSPSHLPLSTLKQTCPLTTLQLLSLIPSRLQASAPRNSLNVCRLHIWLVLIWLVLIECAQAHSIVDGGPPKFSKPTDPREKQERRNLFFQRCLNEKMCPCGSHPGLLCLMEYILWRKHQSCSGQFSQSSCLDLESPGRLGRLTVVGDSSKD